MSYATTVFFSCPFDREYRRLFEAIVFTIYECGFQPRSTLEIDDSDEIRTPKIRVLIEQSRLGIHDLSVMASGPDVLQDLNVPVELGMFLGAKAFGTGVHRRKAGLILDVDVTRETDEESLLAGMDIRYHRAEPEEAICHVRDFLYEHRRARHFLPQADEIVERYYEFRTALEESCAAHRIHEDSLTFRDLTTFIVGWMSVNPLALAA
ncbi:MAG TPA: hypothetical protein VF665_12855 [Longimicrobium sp.]|uniref:hypothetical protein n=1 Tax=Longimicrobium sp. TaxID=2029185 RepID=UPI002EDAA7C6